MKKFVPWIISLVLLLWAVSKMMPPKETPGWICTAFGRLPVLVGGRVMPMDTLARVSLSEWNHHGTYTTADGKVRITDPRIVRHPDDAGTFGYGKTV